MAHMPHRDNPVSLKSHKSLSRKSIQSKGPASIHHQHNSLLPAIEYTSPLDAPPTLNGHEAGLPPTPPSNSREGAPHAPALANGSTHNLTSKKSTPTNQRSPPTPDTTPPASLSPPQRYPSALSSSRAESFRTAREDPWNSEDEMSSLVETVAGRGIGRGQSRSRDLGFGFEGVVDDLTPTQSQSDLPASLRSPKNGSFDPLDRIPNREWDTNIMRNVTVRRKKNKPKQRLEPHSEITTENWNDLPEEMVQPRKRGSKKVHQPVQPISEPIAQPDQAPQTPVKSSFDDTRNITWPMQQRSPGTSQSREEDPNRRNSGMSSSSTVVEALIIHTPPQRQRTLRHVSRNLSLRSDAGSSASASPTIGSGRTSSDLQDHRLRNSQSSTSEGRPVRKIPLYHDKRSVTDPKLRHHHDSGSLRTDAALDGWIGHHGQPHLREKHSHSSHHSPTNGVASRELSSEQSSRASTTSSAHFGSGSSTAYNLSGKGSPASIQRSEVRNSQVAATRNATRRALENALGPVLVKPQSPTNDSVVTVIKKRSGTSEMTENRSLHKRGSSQSHIDEKRNSEDQQPAVSDDHLAPPGMVRRRSDARSERSLDRSLAGTRISMDRSTMRSEDHPRQLYSQNTPFSQTSDLPDGLEVCEAKAVDIYPHNNHSLLVVEQVARQSQAPTRDYPTGLLAQGQPTLTVQPSTPPTQSSELFSDLPAGHVRNPPPPPIIQILPATPASHEVDPLDQVGAHAPIRRLTLMQRARRYSDTLIQPILTRTSSFRRKGSQGKRPGPQDREREERLHPFWQPRTFWDEVSDSESDWGGDSDDHHDRLPAGGDTSDVQEPQGLARVLDGFRGRGGFLIGNSMGLERHGTNNRRHYISLPPNFRIRRNNGDDKGSGSENEESLQQRLAAPRLVKKASLRSLRSVDSRKRTLHRKWKSVALRVEYIGIGGFKDLLREKVNKRVLKRRERKAEVRRERLRKSIGPRILVEA